MISFLLSFLFVLSPWEHCSDSLHEQWISNPPGRSASVSKGDLFFFCNPALVIYRSRLSVYIQVLEFQRHYEEEDQASLTYKWCRSTWIFREKKFIYDRRSEPRPYTSWITYLDLYNSFTCGKYLTHCVTKVVEFKFRFAEGLSNRL